MTEVNLNQKALHKEAEIVGGEIHRLQTAMLF